MSGFISLIFAGIFTDNILTSKLLGVEYSQHRNPIELLKKCGLLTALMLLSSAATYPLIRWVLSPLKAEYLAPFCSVLVICGIFAAAFILAKRLLSSLYIFLDENRKVLTCSAVILGVCLNNFQSDIITGYLSALVYSLAAGLGFTVVSFMLYAVNERLREANLPDFVKGLPMTLLVAALISVAFSGLAGI